MPFMSDREMHKVRNAYGNLRNAGARVKQRVQEQRAAYLSTVECVGAAGAMGWLRGKREDSMGVWNVPFVKFDMELAIGIGLVGASYFGAFKNWKMDDDFLNRW